MIELPTLQHPPSLKVGQMFWWYPRCFLSFSGSGGSFWKSPTLETPAREGNNSFQYHRDAIPESLFAWLRHLSSIQSWKGPLVFIIYNPTSPSNGESNESHPL